MNRGYAAIIAAVLIFGTICIGSSFSAPSTDGTKAAFVLIKDFAFHPRTLTIEPGTSVTWLNGDSASHEIKFPDLESIALNKGDTFVHAFNSTGTFCYICGFYPQMRGTIVVQISNDGDASISM